MAVFVLDKRKQPLMPCSEKRARRLLERGRAVVHRQVPFVIRLKDRCGGEIQPLRLKFDPGSKISRLALVRETPQEAVVLNLYELIHRGQSIHKALTQRSGFRRRRRSCNQRYRAPRFLNRTRPAGWLPPSLRHRLETTLSWVIRFQRWAPITGLSQERVRFDMQRMENPEISGIEYQQGTLQGYEVRGYLLEKFGRKCAYCDAQGVPLEVEHIHPRSQGGSNRVSNLILACRECNEAKDNLPVSVFLAKDPARLQRIQAQAKTPLPDAAAVNATRWALLSRLQDTGLPVETGSGGLTKFNRCRLGIPKTHALDAAWACVGQVTEVQQWQRPSLRINCMGRGSYKRTRLDKYGFPRGYLIRQKSVQGFQTGNRVRADVPTGKKAGIHIGRVAIRASGSFNIQTPQGPIEGVHHRHCRLLQGSDGYGYAQQSKIAIESKEERERAG